MASSYFLLNTNIIISLLVVSILFPSIQSDKSSDRAECTEHVISLSTCLPYVQGEAKAPTPDCCNNLKQVVNKTPKCLCLLIADADTPDAFVQFNVSLAISLPPACHVPNNISHCIDLLKLQPGSKDAKIFEQAALDHDNVGSNVKSGAKSINQVGGIKRWLEGEIVPDMWLPYLLLSIIFVMVG